MIDGKDMVCSAAPSVVVIEIKLLELGTCGTKAGCMCRSNYLLTGGLCVFFLLLFASFSWFLFFLLCAFLVGGGCVMICVI